MVSAFFRHILNSFKTAVRQFIARLWTKSTPVAYLVNRTTPKPLKTTALKAAVFITLVSVMALLGVFSYTRGGASAAASSNLNFQARLLSNTGNVVPDGSYNIEFKIYKSAAAGTSAQSVCSLNASTDDCYWLETRTGANVVTVKNGYLSVNLGSVTPFGSNIPWDQDLWMTMRIGGIGTPTWDTEMTPRFKLTAVPYALRAGKLLDSTNTNAYTADDLIQKAPTLVQALSSASAAIRLNQTGAGGLLQLQNSGADVFTIGNTGAVLIKNSTNSTAVLDVQDSSGNSYLRINTQGAQATFGSNSGTAATLLQGGTNGVQITSGADVTIGAVDANATLLVLDTKNTINDPAGTNGAMYYNSYLSKFRCFENGAWVDCIGGGSYSGSFQSMVSGLQNVPANATALPVETLVFTSSTGVSNTAGVTGFTAPAGGSFRTCVVKNNAAITGGTLAVRWQVNGASVGSSACVMDSTNSRQNTGVLNPGVVTFHAGDTIGIAFDTSNTFTPATDDFTVYWTVEYSGAGGVTGSGNTLQDTYNNSTSASILTADNKNITFQLADTTTDSNFVVDIASGSTGKLKVQNAGVDKFSVDNNGAIVSNSGITLGTSTSTTAGTIRWSGSDFEGYNGAGWVSLTSGSGGGGGLGQNSVTIVKPTNETVYNSSTLQDDDDLVFAIGANETWAYRFVVQANSSTAADLKFAVNAPAGAVCRAAYSDPEGATAGAQYDCGVATTLISGNSASDLYEITGSVTNGSTAGNVTLQWSQYTANTSNTIVYAGSFVQATRTIGAGGNGQPFAQGGNNFGTTATLGTTGADDLSVITNNTEKIRVLANGNVGIGDSTPGSLLSVGTGDAFTVDSSGNTSTKGNLSVLGDTNIGDATTDRLTVTSQLLGANALVFQGATDDAYTTTFAITDPTANNIINVPNASGTFAVSASGNIALSASGNISLTGQVPLANGGTNATTSQGAINNLSGLTTAGDLLYFDGTNTTSLGRGSNGQCLVSSTTTIQWNSCTTGAITAVGTIDTGTYSANGASLSGSNLILQTADGTHTGLINPLPQNIGGVKTFVDGITLTAGKTLTVNGDALTDLTGSNLVNNSGALGVSATPSFTSVTATAFTGDGSALTNLTATNLTGTINDARLSSNVAQLTGAQTFSGLKTFGAGLTLTTGQSLTINGSAFTNLLGNNLAITAGVLGTTNSPSFTTSVTTPIITSTAGLTLDSGNNILSIAASDTTLQRIASGTYTLDLNDAGATTFAINNTAAGAASINLVDGGLQTAGTSRLTNGGALQNITGLTVASGGASVTGASTFANDVALNGNTTIGDATTDRLTVTAQILGGNSLVFQGATDDAFTTTFAITDPTANRTITIPNDSGLLALIGVGSAQVDATTNSSLNINKTGASGNILTLAKGGTSVFTISNSGATTISNTSTSAFTVNNAGAATQLFNVDTSGSIVQVGNLSDTVGVILVLSNKTTSADPTGQEGAEYYNAAMSSFRCYQGARGWTDCLGLPKPNTRRTTRLDYAGSGTAVFAGQGDVAVTVGTASGIAATNAEPTMLNYATSNVNGNVASTSGNLNYSTNNTPSYQTYLRLTSTVTERVWSGITNQTAATMGASANPAGNYAAFRYDTSVAGETTWKCVTKDNVTQTISDSGIAVTTAGIKMEIIETATDVVFKLDNVVVCDNTTYLPATNTLVRFSSSLTNLTAASHSIRFAWIYVEADI